GNPHIDIQDKGVIDSGCSRHMTGNISCLTDYEDIDGGYVAFGGNPKGGKITGKCTIKTGNLDFENLIDESQVLLRVPRKNNMYSVDLKNIVPKGGLTCLFAKATSDESKLWHRRLGHLNFKTMNKLVKGNLVRGLPSKLFENDQTCVACQKGKQHRASCKSKTKNSISLPLHLLHMDLFGLTFVKSLMKKMYCLVVTDDYSRFTWVFFLATKDETSGILKSFITGIENLVDHKVKVIIRCDNRTDTITSTKASDNAGQTRKETKLVKNYILLPLWTADPPYSQDLKSSHDDGSKPSCDDGNKVDEDPRKESEFQQKKDGIFISQDKYVVEILKKFRFTEVKTASTPMETKKPLLKDEDYEEVDVHMYRSMIGSLMYLTSSRPDIMFAVCACARYQVNPKVSHLHAVKMIFRYLKGQPKLGLWYPKDSSFDLVAYTNSDYVGASLDRKSTTRGCQFLGCRLISWQCKKQTVVANSITEAEYVAASSCCGQVLWIQNPLLDYGCNFMHTKIFIDNNRKAKKSVKLMMEKLFIIEL
ncbi:putative ribonuclease H-like domain-containing protein, partial [Tanacetum coccineum]